MRRAGELPDLKPLYAWFRNECRDLPFRRNRNPYRVWIAETMLQQTRVKSMETRFAEFIERFPDLHSLAGAGEERVLHAWRGLGYYNRARNLHRAARIICERHDGRIPRDEKDLLELPGVGEYTRAAVLSICFNRPLPVLDGNVRRVLRRLESLDEKSNGNDLRRLKDLARRCMEGRKGAGPGLHNESLMELGALICKPKKPACEICPLVRQCRAAPGLKRESPVGNKTGEIKTDGSRIPLAVRLFIITDSSRKRVWLIRDRRSGFYRNLWIFPSERFLPQSSAERLSKAAKIVGQSRCPAAGRTIGLPEEWCGTKRRKHAEPEFSFRHSLLNYNLQVDVELRFADRLDPDFPPSSDDTETVSVEWKLIPWEEADRYLIASLGGKALARIRETGFAFAGDTEGQSRSF